MLNHVLPNTPRNRRLPKPSPKLPSSHPNIMQPFHPTPNIPSFLLSVLTSHLPKSEIDTLTTNSKHKHPLSQRSPRKPKISGWTDIRQRAPPYHWRNGTTPSLLRNSDAHNSHFSKCGNQNSKCISQRSSSPLLLTYRPLLNLCVGEREEHKNDLFLSAN